MSSLRVRDLAALREVQALRAENERLRENIEALRAALLEQAQLAEEAGLVLRGIYRVARGVAYDRSDPAADDVQAGGRGEPTWPDTSSLSPPP